MYTTEIKVRVRYGETDRMGYVYYGNYAQYFEVARVEALRNLGFSYRKLEDEGIMLPVINYAVKYIRPAFYDDELTIKVTIPEIPLARIRFDYEIYNEKDELTTVADTTLVFIDRSTNKPCPAPGDFTDALMKFFSP
ncbi:MAG: thioesterase family protein [Bacteroidota bacterium]